ncbi:hypothetical protein ACK2FW_08300 [Clostridioides difficile]
MNSSISKRGTVSVYLEISSIGINISVDGEGVIFNSLHVLLYSSLILCGAFSYVNV